MKSTGIIRRIDDLGRIVIPKEIRRSMRIREGDPMELLVDGDSVVFKKFSQIGEIASFAQSYADVLFSQCGMPVLICDRDYVVAAAGVPNREFIQRRIADGINGIIDSRRTGMATPENPHRIQPAEGIDRWASVVEPIITSDDSAGAVCLLLPESGSLPDQCDVKLVKATAAFLGRQIEQQ